MKIVKRIKNTKSVGLDDISSRVLKLATFACFSSSGKMFCLILLLIIEAIGIESPSVANFNTRDDISSRPTDLVLYTFNYFHNFK